mmetsp:Transcript_134082/g.286702  ORF Transcript_134082/g.286702 Transcript_134082/m.286702 type:complete len:222 (+) Transcript_134082:1807-2472(+)
MRSPSLPWRPWQGQWQQVQIAYVRRSTMKAVWCESPAEKQGGPTTSPPSHPFSDRATAAAWPSTSELSTLLPRLGHCRRPVAPALARRRSPPCEKAPRAAEPRSDLHPARHLKHHRWHRGGWLRYFALRRASAGAVPTESHHLSCCHRSLQHSTLRPSRRRSGHRRQGSLAPTRPPRPSTTLAPRQASHGTKNGRTPSRPVPFHQSCLACVVSPVASSRTV